MPQKIHFLRWVLILATFLAGRSVSAGAAESIYTDLTIPLCKTLKTEEQEMGTATDKCPGVGGYELLTHFDDERQSVTVIAPGGKKHDLNFWEVITRSFSSLGKKAEWRVFQKDGKKVPLALIVRVDTHSDSPHPTSYLAVSKITPAQICVTDRIPPGPDQNEKARAAADVSQDKPCLGSR